MSFYLQGSLNGTYEAELGVWSSENHYHRILRFHLIPPHFAHL